MVLEDVDVMGANGDAAVDLDLEVGGGKYEAVDTDFDPFAVDDNVGADSSMVEQPVKLEWKDLTYTARSSGSKIPFLSKEASEKKILHEVSGAVYPGQMLAIMGSSGAGKTTLLNLLAGRLTSSKNVETGGHVLVNGEKRNFATFKRLAAYVEQDDNMFAEVTVKEQVRFSANLRLARTLDRRQRDAKADGIVAELGLNGVRDSFIGSPLKRGISGGERKRVNIGTELVTNPSLIFLDEPTSGLDSFNSLNVMHTLQLLARRGRTVVTTIHQPRSNIFSMFDRLLLLSKGRVMYFGPAQDAAAYFAGLNYRCPPAFNPADYFIDLISWDHRTQDKEKKSSLRIEQLEEAYRKHREVEGPDAHSDTDVGSPAALEASAQAGAGGQRKYAASRLPELLYVMRRQAVGQLRQTEVNISETVVNTVFAVLLGLVWLNVGRDFFADPGAEGLESEFQALVGAMLFVVVNQAFGATYTVTFVFPAERSVVLRERASGTYRVSSYFVGKTLVELPRTMLINLLFCVITYFLIGFRPTAAAFFVFYFTVLLITLAAQSLTIAIATLTSDAQVTSTIVPVFVVLALLFAGFFISDDLIPGFLAWLQYLSFIKYGLTAIALTQFRDIEPWISIVDEQYGDVSLGTCIGVLFATVVFLRLLAYVFLRINGPKFDKSL